MWIAILKRVIDRLFHTYWYASSFLLTIIHHSPSNHSFTSLIGSILSIPWFIYAYISSFIKFFVHYSSKGEGIVHTTPEILVQFIQSPNTTTEIDPSLLEREEIVKLSEASRIMRLRYKFPAMLSNREFVVHAYLNHKQRLSGNILTPIVTMGSYRRIQRLLCVRVFLLNMRCAKRIRNMFVV